MPHCPRKWWGSISSALRCSDSEPAKSRARSRSNPRMVATITDKGSMSAARSRCRRASAVRPSIIRKGALQLVLGRAPVPVLEEAHQAQGDAGLRQLRVALERALGGLDRERPGVL